ncbi:MAG TPA: EthD domain-containing protein [Dehalococcoidales bacterium]|nr:EthD domain-containing protein [Dehalococcoidales bacterium]
MIKSIALAYRKAGMSHEEFVNYWKNVHAPLAKAIPGMRKYVQNYILPVPGREDEADGIVEMWWDDIESYQKFLAWVQTEAGRELREDGDKFSDMRKGRMWLAEEYIVVDNTRKK